MVKVSQWCRRTHKVAIGLCLDQSVCLCPRHGRKQNDRLAYWDHVKLPRSQPLTQPSGACRLAQASSRKARAMDGWPSFVQSPKVGPKDVSAGPARPVSNTDRRRNRKYMHLQATFVIMFWGAEVPPSLFVGYPLLANFLVQCLVIVSLKSLLSSINLSNAHHILPTINPLRCRD